MEPMERATNVQVAVRCRPINADEEKRGFVPIVSCDTQKRLVKINYGAGVKKTTKTFGYDACFSQFAKQEDVFKATVAPMIDEVLNGFSCTCFAYGQTGTGKTHTMEGNLGDAKDYGIIPRAVAAIFEKLEASGVDFTVRVSFLEIYQEQLEDLLEPSSASAGPSKAGGAAAAAKGGGGLRLVDDTKKGVQVLGLEEIGCADLPSAIALLQRGVRNRATAATLCNKNSSRSHSVFTLKVVAKETNAATGEEEVRAGTLNLVDLAGSESTKRSGAVNERAREAGNINQSLLTLGRVITALTEGHSHIPYRDSKLTRLLQESLGGRAKTWIIATLSPIASNVEETLSTLEYALKAKSIKNKPEVNARSNSKTMMREFAGEIDSLKSQLLAQREKNGVYLPAAEYEQMQAKLSAQADQINEVEQALRQREEELEEARGAVAGVQARLDAATEQLQRTEAELAKSREANARLTGELKETRCELVGARAVIGEQAKTETELRGQAETLAGSLEAARGDVQGLLAKVERSAAALAARSQAAQTLLADCQALLLQGKTAAAGVDSAGEAAAGALEAAVAALVEKEVNETARVLQSLAEEVDGLVREGGDAAARVGKEMCARLSKEVVAVLVAQSQQQTAALLERAKAYEVEAAAGTQVVTAAFAQARASVEETLGRIGTLASQGKMTVELLSVHGGQADALAEGAAAFAKAAAEKEQAAEAARAAFVQEQQAAVAAGAQAILQSVQQQVGKLLADCEARGQAFDAAAQAGRAERAAHVAGHAERMAAGLAVAKALVAEKCEALVVEVLDPQVGATEAVRAAWDATLVPAHAAAVGKVGEEAVGLVRGLEGKAAEADASMQATLAAGQAVITSIEAETGKVEALLTEKGSAVAGAMSQVGQASASRLMEQKGAFASMVQTQLREPLAAGVAGVQAAFAQTEGTVTTYSAAAGRVEPPTNGTPQKREYPHPGAFSSTRPHAEIMAEARARAALQLEGEVVMEAAAPAPAVMAVAAGASQEEEQQEGAEKRGAAAEEESPNKKPRLSAEPPAHVAGPGVAVAGHEPEAPAAAMEQEQEQEEPAVPAVAAAEAAPATKAVAGGNGIPAPSKGKTASSRIPRPSGIKPLGDIKNVR